jgi:hypothetical protein
VYKNLFGRSKIRLYVYINKINNNMTVQELIKRLNRVKDKSIEVIVQGTDPTDWIYYKEIDDCGIEKILLVDTDEKLTKVFLIDGGCF